jgi:hypothetical protein
MPNTNSQPNLNIQNSSNSFMEFIKLTYSNFKSIKRRNSAH